MRSSSAAYKLACELIGATFAALWNIPSPNMDFIKIRREHWTDGIVTTRNLSAPAIGYEMLDGVIRPEISEQLSLGIIIVDGDKVNVRYSTEKLHVIRGLYSKSEYEFVDKVMKNLSSGNVIKSTDAINYLTRYSNNLIAISSLQDIDLDSSQESQDWLYRNYVYEGA